MDNKGKIDSIIMDNKRVYFNYSNGLDAIKDLVLEFINCEKSEYITSKVRYYYANELMLENLLDALLLGKI